MKNILFIVICIMLVLSLTSALVGNNAPTLKTFILKASEVSVDLNVIYTLFADDVSTATIDTLETTGEWYDFLIILLNGLITAINFSVIAPFVVLYDIFAKFDLVLDMFKGFYECAVYLLFGESVNS